MREIRCAVVDIDRYLEDAVRAKQQFDADRWRQELRPRALRHVAARTTKLTWSRALLKLVVEELYPDDCFADLVGNVDRVPRLQWPRVLAFSATRTCPDHHEPHSPARLGPVKALRFASTALRAAHGLDRALGRAMNRHLRDGRAVMKDFAERSSPMRQLSITPNITVTIGHHTRLYFAYDTTYADHEEQTRDEVA